MSKLTRRDSVSVMSAVRSGGSAVYVLLGVVISIVVIASFLWLFVGWGGEDSADRPLLAAVTRSPFQYAVLENGEVESSKNVEIRCEIRMRGGGGVPGPSTTLLDVIPEGSPVQKGDWLITFDSAMLEQEKRTEQITLNTMEASMIDAKAQYDTALITREEFLASGLGRININLDEDAARLQISSPSGASGSSQSTRGASGSSGASGRSGASGGSTASGRSGASGGFTASAGSGASGRSGASGGTGASGGSGASGTTSSQSNSSTQRSNSSTQSSAGAQWDPAKEAPVPLVNPSYGELKRFIENEIFVADNSLKKAHLSFDSMKRMVARGLVARSQLEAERFRVDAAQNVMDLAQQKLVALEDYTKKKMLVQLESNFQVAEVRYRSAKKTYEEQLAKLKEIDDQIAKCRVVSPAAGLVVYKNVQSSRADSEFVVEPGALIYENQVILMLPDPAQMQVKTLVDESWINLVRDGMPVTVQIDALRSVHQGTVIKVNKYAEPTNFFSSSSSKQYLTLISLTDPPPEIRVGLTAQVRILIEERADALQLPFQAVLQQGGKTFCLVKKDEGWETREIVLSTTNGKTVVLDETVSQPWSVGDQVVLNPKKHIHLFDQSRFPQEQKKKSETKAAPEAKA